MSSGFIYRPKEIIPNLEERVLEVVQSQFSVEPRGGFIYKPLIESSSLDARVAEMIRAAMEAAEHGVVTVSMRTTATHLQYRVNDGSWTNLIALSELGSMVYPDAGIALSTGSGWGTSIVGTNNRFPIFTAAGIANSNFSQDTNKIVNTVTNSAIEFHSLGFYFTHNTANQFVIGTGGTNLLFLTDLSNIVFSKGIRIYSGQTFSAEDSISSHGKHTVITGGNVSGSGNYNGGNIQFLRGTGIGSGVLGNIYFGDAFTLLPAKSSETNVIYYDTTDGKISYGAVTTGVSETKTVVTDVRSNAGQMQKKTQTMTYTNGILTSVGVESDWTDTTDV